MFLLSYILCVTTHAQLYISSPIFYILVVSDHCFIPGNCLFFSECKFTIVEQISAK